MKKWKITYWADGDRTIEKTEIIETDETREQLRGHAHMISVEPVEEKKVEESKAPVKKGK